MQLLVTIKFWASSQRFNIITKKQNNFRMWTLIFLMWVLFLIGAGKHLTCFTIWAKTPAAHAGDWW